MMAFWAAGAMVVLSIAACIRSTAEEREDLLSYSQLTNPEGQSDMIQPIDDLFLEIPSESTNIKPWNTQSIILKSIYDPYEDESYAEDTRLPQKSQNGNQAHTLSERKGQESISGNSPNVNHEDRKKQAADGRSRNDSWGLDITEGNHGNARTENNNRILIPHQRRPRIMGNAQKDVLDSILTGYDVNEWPHFYYGKKTDVHVQMFINAFGSLNAESMDFRIDLFLRQAWQDPRLAYSDKRDHLIVVDPETHKRIWRPDTYFDNVKVAQVHSVTVPNVMLRITRMGDVMYTMRLALLLTCNMQLRLYPFDTQYCYVEMSSLSSTDDMLTYHWHDYLPVKIAGNLEIAEFDLIGHQAKETRLPFATGNYSGLQAKFTLRRQNGFHLLQTYVPTILIVSMSWVSFWLDPNAVPGRVTLGVTTLLTLTTLASGVRQSLPKVSYIKAVDVWLGMCMVMIFGVLIEFTAVNSLANKKKDIRLISKGPGHGFVKLPPKTYITNARRIDCFSRILFPAVFLLFNIFYWTYYLLLLYHEDPKIPFTF